MSDYTHRLIAHATSNEYRRTSNGEIGDQCGHELCACHWFEAGWSRVYIAQDADKRERMARFAEEAVTNGYFGYSQYWDFRERFIRQANLHDFHPEMVNINRTCDCSTLIYGAILAAFGKEYKFSDDYATPPTTDEFDDYVASKFPQGTWVKHEKSEPYAIGPSTLERGHILWMNGHIAIWI